MTQQVLKATAGSGTLTRRPSCTLAIHGSSDFLGSVDAFSVSVPLSLLWASHELSEKELNEAFDLFDEDRSGEIDATELSALARKLGQPLSKKQLEEAMAAMDADGSGSVDREEFSVWFRANGSGNGSGNGMDLAAIRQQAKLKKVGSRLGDAFVALLAHHYRYSTQPAGSGAERRHFKVKDWSRRAQDRSLRITSRRLEV